MTNGQSAYVFRVVREVDGEVEALSIDYGSLEETKHELLANPGAFVGKYQRDHDGLAWWVSDYELHQNGWRDRPV